MDSLFEIIVAAVIALFWLLGGRSQRPRQNRPAPRPHPRPRPTVERPQRAPEEPADDRQRALRHLGELLGVEFETAPAPEEFETTPEPEEKSLEELVREERRVPERGSLETILPFEAVSLESLNVTRRPRGPTPAAPMPAPRPAARSRLRATPRTLREAVIWREILGPPKSLE